MVLGETDCWPQVMSTVVDSLTDWSDISSQLMEVKIFQRAGYEKIVEVGVVNTDGLGSKSVYEVVVFIVWLYFFSNQ